METVRTVADLRATVAAWRAGGARVALVPTMGGLHAGHLSLVEVARRAADRVVASVFVNPTQFGAGEDFETYPRDEAGDAAALSGAGCDLLYAPDGAEMYPPGFATEIRVTGLTDTLCGAARPGHFDGVAQVVAKLLIQAGPDCAVFGEKDWQQLVVIRRLVRDLDLPVAILGAPILREADGLALSSRNRYLTAAERAVAPRLHAEMAQAAAAIVAGAPVAESLADGRRALAEAGFGPIDYLEMREAATLAPCPEWPGAGPSRLFAAAYLGRTRLIDNLPVGA